MDFPPCASCSERPGHIIRNYDGTGDKRYCKPCSESMDEVATHLFWKHQDPAKWIDLSWNPEATDA